MRDVDEILKAASASAMPDSGFGHVLCNGTRSIMPFHILEKGYHSVIYMCRIRKVAKSGGMESRSRPKVVTSHHGSVSPRRELTSTVRHAVALQALCIVGQSDATACKTR